MTLIQVHNPYWWLGLFVGQLLVWTAVFLVRDALSRRRK